jgi:hypothetical protein
MGASGTIDACAFVGPAVALGSLAVSIGRSGVVAASLPALPDAPVAGSDAFAATPGVSPVRNSPVRTALDAASPDVLVAGSDAFAPTRGATSGECPV